MREKSLTDNQRDLFCLIASFVCLLVFLFVSCQMRARVLYRKTLSIVEPSERFVKLEYYLDIFNILSSAINCSKGNADYYIHKARFYEKAIDEDFSQELGIDNSDVRDLYAKALRTNPLNYTYHLYLGWFYRDTYPVLAESELKKSARLDQYNPEGYLYLAKFYLQQGDVWRGYINLALALQYLEGDRYKRVANIIWNISDEIRKTPEVSLGNGVVKYSFPVYTYIFDFRDQYVPRSPIKIRVRVYVKEDPQEVILANQYIQYDKFKLIEKTPEFTVYQYNLSRLPRDILFKDLSIKTLTYSPIEKIELIKDF